MPLYQKRTTFCFDCNHCEKVIEVTHILWTAVVCLYCGEEVYQKDIKFYKKKDLQNGL